MMIWWLVACSFDRTPPVVRVATPDGPVSGVLSLPISASDAQPGVAAVDVTFAGSSVVMDDAIEVDTTSVSDGAHRVTVRVRDGSLFSNTTAVDVDLVVDNTPPVLHVADVTVPQGRASGLTVSASEPLASAVVQALGNSYEGEVDAAGGAWVVVGASTEQPTGQTAIQVVAHDLAGNRSDLQATMSVTDVRYPSSGFIQLTDAQVAARRDDTSREDADRLRRLAYTEQSVPRSWDGGLGSPVVGRRTSGFGKLRVYSDGARQVHGGLDIAAPTGTPVVAPADGVVTLAQPLAIYGNAVVVVHGLGVATSYSHLSRIDVDAGQSVERGDRLGRVGSTGQSTGPHLHFSVAVGGVEVDPVQWLDDGGIAPE